MAETSRMMQDRQIRRHIILDHDNWSVGIASLADLTVKTGDDEQAGETLERISEPTGSY